MFRFGSRIDERSGDERKSYGTKGSQVMDNRRRHRPPTITTTTMAPITTTTTPRPTTIPPWTLAMDRVTIQVHSHLTIPVTTWTFLDPPVATSHPRHRQCRLRPRQQLPCPGSEVYRDPGFPNGFGHHHHHHHQSGSSPSVTTSSAASTAAQAAAAACAAVSRIGSGFPNGFYPTIPHPMGSVANTYRFVAKQFAHSRHYLSLFNLCFVSWHSWYILPRSRYSSHGESLQLWPDTFRGWLPVVTPFGRILWKESGNVSREMNQILIRESSEDRIIWSFFVHLFDEMNHMPQIFLTRMFSDF